MNAGVAVLVPNTPPDSAKVLAIFVEGASQDHQAALAAANAYKTANSPTSVVQDCTVDKYNTGVVITS